MTTRVLGGACALLFGLAVSGQAAAKACVPHGNFHPPPKIDLDHVKVGHGPGLFGHDHKGWFGSDRHHGPLVKTDEHHDHDYKPKVADRWSWARWFHPKHADRG